MPTNQSKIDHLISKLCPNGVEFKTLGEVGSFTRGKRFVKDNIISCGVPCIHYGELYTHYKIWAKETTSFLESSIASKLRSAHYGDVILVAAGETIEDIGNAVAWLGESDVIIHDACFAYSHKQNPKYISYFFRTDSFRSQIKKYISSGKISAIKANGLEKAIIPLPPLEIQNAIVNILDKFTELETELETELDARKKQYQWYKNNLLEISGVEFESVGKVLNRTKGTQITASQMNELNKKDGPIKIIAGGKTVAYVDYGDIPDKDVLNNKSIVVKSRGVIEFEYIDQPFSHKNEFWSYNSSDPNINIKYVFYYLKNQEKYFQKLASKMQMPQISLPDIEKYKIPTPPLSEQEKIVSILDKFDALVNDISIGLPAEIKARRQQYEYYRNKLLTFKEYDPKQ